MTSDSALDSNWAEFLQSQNVQFDETGKISTFGHADLERFLIKNGPVITSLTHQALIKVSGSEAETFLQSQLTNDLTQVTETQAQFSAYCDPKGNVIATFLVFNYKGDYYLSFDGSMSDTVIKRLKMFVLRADVQIEDVSNSMIQVGFAGEFGDLDVQRQLSTKIKEIFEAGMLQAEGMEDCYIIKVPGPYHKYSLFGPAQQMTEAWKKLRGNSDLTNNYDWQLLDIAAGIPNIETPTTNQFIPQSLNLDKFEAINFKKGCFPGQEIIARTHYRGKVTKRMLRLHIGEVVKLTAGEDLLLKDSNDRKHKMTVISSAEDIFEGTLCLAVASLKPLESVEGDLMTESGKTVSIEPLPYKITEEE
jgi:folate-binding protein YgfZ